MVMIASFPADCQWFSLIMFAPCLMKDDIDDHDGRQVMMTLDSQHIQAIDAVRKAMKTPSRMAILTELSRSDTRSVRGSSGIFHQENFQLRLAPPIAPTNS
ncbi:Hypothetical predicted protein [Mytilus galloprovincialis]|uniref:Uncharacterized protein n=1 Tax=Mytilus galloprovincialis TaxID=29158 RepID=A0A8B6FF55_MYTGA|nr:Hypothetical predicted protein [Mytilus galloprovincialis]